MQASTHTTSLASANTPGMVRDAGKIKSRVAGMLLEKDLLTKLSTPQVELSHTRELLATLAEWMVKSPIIRSNRGSINLLMQQWSGQSGATNEAPPGTEEVYVSLGVSYYLTKDWEVVRELSCVGIAVDIFDDLYGNFGIGVPSNLDRSHSSQDTHKNLSGMFEDILDASSRQNLTAAICLVSLVIEKKNNEPTFRYVSPSDALRIMTIYIDRSNDLLGSPLTAMEVLGYANDWTRGFGASSGTLKQSFDHSPFLRPEACLKELEQTVLVMGEFSEPDSSNISLCLFDLEPSRSTAQGQPPGIIDQPSTRFKPLLEQLETVQSLPFTVLALEDNVPHPPRLLEPPKHIGRGFPLNLERIILSGFSDTTVGLPAPSVSIFLTRWINQVRTHGLSTYFLPPASNTYSAPSSNPQPTLIERFNPDTPHATAYHNMPTEITIYESITCSPPYRNWSFEELRLTDYALGIRGAADAGSYRQGYSYEELRLADYAQGRRWVAKGR
ncbi:MAG: hypothetical protein M1822_005045 [Bathelium mastoideum]|nr:MAG: hypothetical protein M1822_005045 [Bathelium mastoideum]